MPGSVLPYLALGLALGAASSLPPGPCNLAVIGAAVRHSLRRSIATGLGAAIGDTMYAALGIVGVGPALARSPTVPVLQTVSGVALIIYGVASLRTSATAPEPRAGRGVAQRGQAMRGLAVGLGLLLANPAAIVTWVVIVGSYLGAASPAQSWCAVAGIGIGSFAWFAVVANLAHRGKHVHAAGLHRVTTLVSALLVAYGVVAVARAAGWLVG